MAAVKIAIGMVTCDRRQFGKQDYLGRTLASLDASGFFHQIEGDEFKVFDAGYGESRFGVAANFHRAFDWIANQPGDVDWGIVLEDDVEFCRNWLPRAKQWLRGVAPRDGAFYSFCTNVAFTADPANIANGWTEWPWEIHWGGMCQAYKKSWLRMYLASDERAACDALGLSVDIHTARFVGRTGQKIYAHCPNLARHIAHDAHPEYPWFPGVEYDAMSSEQTK